MEWDKLSLACVTAAVLPMAFTSVTVTGGSDFLSLSYILCLSLSTCVYCVWARLTFLVLLGPPS